MNTAKLVMHVYKFSTQLELKAGIERLSLQLTKLPTRAKKRSFIVKGLSIEVHPSVHHELKQLRDRQRAMATID